MIKYLIIAFLTLIFITASDPFFGTELSFRPLPPVEKGDVRELPWMTTDAFNKYLMDTEDRVDDAFPVTPFFFPNVHFWFLIYTQFESSHVIIHDRDNLSLIYKVLDFTSLHEKNLPRNVLYVLQQKISFEKVEKLKKSLDHLAMNPYSLEHDAKSLYRMIKDAGLKLPIAKPERSLFFNKLRNNLRTQTGQKNFIREGIIRSQPYQKFLTTYFHDRKLPSELLAIPFLESSFNPKAESKVNALGAWQFMPLISSYYKPKRTDQFDYRSNVGVSSVSAAFLMSENFQIMKGWDLAVTAYNSGTKHLLKSKRKIASASVDLEDIIRHSDSQHFGFASKNFYSEFLALAHTLAYREEIYKGLHHEDRSSVNQMLDFYLAKCSFRLDKFLNKDQLDDVLFHNHQITSPTIILPRGAIITAKESLPKTKFYQLSLNQILKTKPKDWMAFLGNQSCSTK